LPDYKASAPKRWLRVAIAAALLYNGNRLILPKQWGSKRLLD